MTVYNYTAIKDGTNELVKGKVEADDLREARAAVRRLGFTPTNIVEEQAVKKDEKKKPTGKTLYIMDEPATGLHSADIKRLLAIIQKIVDNRDTVVIIEHNLDVIKVADYIIDLGPEGGSGGGTIIATGTPEEIAKNESSYTGQYLKKYLK